MTKFLDLGFPHAARVTQILQGRKAPIPVVDADIYPREADVECFTQDRVPAKVTPPNAGGCIGWILAMMSILALTTFAASLIARC